MHQSDEKLGTGLQIGGVELTGRTILAPMSGVSDVGMRRLAERFGAAFTLTEMVACDDYVGGGAEARIRAEATGIGPHAVQLAGCDRHWMAEAARLAEAAGAVMIDINMGCPAKRVTGGYAGSALMRDLDEAQRLVEAAVGAVKVPVTLKMRLGWDDASRNAAELARRAEAAGVKLITVHGRTGQQFYKGCADWPAIRAVKRALKRIPLVANGDCGSLEDALAMLNLSGADAVMIGRGAVGRPWLVGDIDHFVRFGVCRGRIDTSAQLEAALQHYDSLLATFGREKGLRHARKHLTAYAAHAGATRDEVVRLVTSEDPATVARVLTQVFRNNTGVGLPQVSHFNGCRTFMLPGEVLDPPRRFAA
jgi:tRNA-dihydrouridine synthase B